jgi:hypothetical protein
VKISRSIALIAILLLLFSCLPKKPEIPGARVTADPFLLALEHQRQAVATLKAIASIGVVRGGKKRSFDTVGIVFDTQRRLRIEAFGPLGQSLVALVWDGKDMLVRLQDGGIKKPGRAGIEKMLGIGMDAKDLCAILSGTVTEIARPQDAQAFCTQDGTCVLEFQEGEAVRRVIVLAPVSSPLIRIAGQELYRSETLVYRVRYSQEETIGHGLLPRNVVVENPEKQVALTIEYTEADVNVPVPDDAFTLTDAVTGAGIR